MNPLVAVEPFSHPAFLLVLGTGLTMLSAAAVAVAKLLVSLRDAVRDVKGEVVNMRRDREGDQSERSERQHETDVEMAASEMRQVLIERSIVEMRHAIRQLELLVRRIARHVGIEE